MTAKKAVENNSDQTVFPKTSKKASTKAAKKIAKRTSSRRGAIYENLLAPDQRSSSLPLPLVFTELLNLDPDEYVLDAELVKEKLKQSGSEFRKLGPDDANRLIELLAKLAARPPEEKLKWFHSAMLYRFIEEYESGAGIHQSVLEFLYNVFTDVLEGLPFDIAICLPGREARREWTGVSRSQRERQEAAQFVSDALRFGVDKDMQKLYPNEPPEAVATLAAAKLWSKSSAWVRSARTEYDSRENRLKDGSTDKSRQKNSRKLKKSGMKSTSI